MYGIALWKNYTAQVMNRMESCFNKCLKIFFGYPKFSSVTNMLFAMAYLGFHKGGPNFLWPLVLTQRGPNQVFQIFSHVKKNFAKGGPWPNGPLNTPLLV